MLAASALSLKRKNRRPTPLGGGVVDKSGKATVATRCEPLSADGRASRAPRCEGCSLCGLLDDHDNSLQFKKPFLDESPDRIRFVACARSRYAVYLFVCDHLLDKLAKGTDNWHASHFTKVLTRPEQQWHHYLRGMFTLNNLGKKGESHDLLAVMEEVRPLLEGAARHHGMQL
jgi:hypothetical protein